MGSERQEALDEVKAKFRAQFPVDTGRRSNMRLDPRRRVTRFAEAMEAILRDNDYKGGWEDCLLEYLEAKLVEEVGEYFRIVANEPHRSGGGKELLDIANFCMMIYERIVPVISLSSGDNEVENDIKR